MEENTVVTFIAKLFYLGPKTRTVIPKPNRKPKLFSQHECDYEVRRQSRQL